MKPKDDLFILIKSLTKTEKGYFNKFAQMHGGTAEGNYLKLYHLIEGMETYNEAELKKSVAGTSLGKHLSVSKNYLFKFILRALSSFHRDNIPELQIYHLLAEEHMLRARRLGISSEAQLKKAESVAAQFRETQFSTLLQWIKYDQNIRTSFEEETDEAYAIWRNDFLQTGEYQLQEMQLAALHMDVLRARRNFVQYERILHEAIIHPLIKADPVHLSVKSRIVFWAIWIRYYRLKSDMPKYIEANQAFYAMLEQLPIEFRDKNTHLVINTLAILGAAWLQEENKTEIEKVLEKLANVDLSKHPGLERHKKRCVLETTLAYLRLFGSPGDMSAFEKEYRQVIDHIYATEIPLNQGAIRFMLGVGLMFEGETTAALDYFNWLLNDKTFSAFDYSPFCWYWTILAHNEMGNKSLLPSLINSAQNANKKRLITRPAETALLKNLKALAKVSTPAKELALLSLMRVELQQALKTANPADRRGYVELEEWLANKAEAA